MKVRFAEAKRVALERLDVASRHTGEKARRFENREEPKRYLVILFNNM